MLSDLQKRILEELGSKYPDEMDVDELVKRVRIPRSDVERELEYFKEKGIVETTGFIGERFHLARLTAKGRDFLWQGRFDLI